MADQDIIFETDIYDPEIEADRIIGECGYCGNKLPLSYLNDVDEEKVGICSSCQSAEEEDYKETMRGANAYLNAIGFGR